MPPGYVHLNIWKRYLKFVPMISAGLAVIHWQLGLGFLFGYLVGYYIDPDLDQVGLSAAEGRLLDDFKIFGAIFISVWLPYGYVSKHRGISHYPVLGTLTRWVYLLGIMASFIRPTLLQLQALGTGLVFLVGIFLGNSFSDLIHSGADFGFIKIKRGDRK